MITALIPTLAPIISRIVGNLFPDPEAKVEAEQKAMQGLLAAQHEIEQVAADIIRTEAASQHWLAANWRPITMLIFVGLIVARWFGFAAPNLSESEYLKLWSIVELGLGGYVIGRTAEKVTPSLINAIKGNR